MFRNQLANSAEYATGFAGSPGIHVLQPLDNLLLPSDYREIEHYIAVHKLPILQSVNPYEYKGLWQVQSLVTSPDQKFLYTAGLHAAGVYALEDDSAISVQTLVPDSLQADIPHVFRISPDGLELYGGADSALYVFDRNRETGLLTVHQTIPATVPGAPERDIVISIDGRDLYTVTPDAVIRYQKGPDGTWTQQNILQYGASGITALCLTPDGRWAYAAAPEINAVQTYERDAKTGLLRQHATTPVDQLPESPVFLLSPDGHHLYVGRSNNGYLDIYAINPSKGALVKQEGLPVDIHGISRAAFSPDGLQLFAYSSSLDQMLVLHRSVVSGQVSVQLEIPMPDTVNALYVTGDGQSVITADATQPALNVWRRNVTWPTGVPEDAVELLQNSPNPFNPGTTIMYRLQYAARVKIELYDVLGRKIRTLMNERRLAGTYTIGWDGTNESGIAVASGLYIYVLSIDGKPATSRKMLLLR